MPQVTEQDARKVAEAARQTEWEKPSFGKELFLGHFRLDLISPHPRSSEEDRRKGEAFLATLEAFLEYQRAVLARKAEGLSDELFTNCSPHQFYLLIPTLLRQSVTAYQRGKLTHDLLKAGLDCKCATILDAPSLT